MEKQPVPLELKIVKQIAPISQEKKENNKPIVIAGGMIGQISIPIPEKIRERLNGWGKLHL